MKKFLVLSISCALMACSSSVKKESLPNEQSKSTYHNPVVDYSLPDPSVIKGDDGYFYLYATEDIRHLPIHRSKNLVDLSLIHI